MENVETDLQRFADEKTIIFYDAFNRAKMFRLPGKSPNLSIGFLGRESLPELLSLEAIIAEDLPSPEIFLLHDEEFFREGISRPNSALGIFNRNRLVAYSILRIPGASRPDMPHNLGRDIDLPEEDLIEVAHIQAITVHPAWRGHGLQRRLARAHLKLAEDSGYHHICCTVSPKNPKSLANMLSCGLLIEALLPKFHGWWRFILHKDLRKAHPGLSAGFDSMAEETSISLADLEGQSSLLERGFKGFGVKAPSGAAMVIYRRANPGKMNDFVIDAD